MYVSIAICDDDIKIQFILEKYMKRIFESYDIETEIECFDTGDSFCKNYRRGRYDLIFLDIEYPGKNGVETGRYIREEALDEDAQIVYISGNTGYAMELFEHHPINFLVKPISEADIKRVVNKYLLLARRNIEKFQYKIGSDVFRVAFSEILYFSSNARKITIHGKEESAEFYALLDTIYEQVKEKDFLYVHKSYLVNYQHIRKMQYEQLILCDGTVIPISQSRRPAIRKQFLEIKKGEMR